MADLLFYPVEGPTRYVDRNVTVVEHRAPTTESARLYGEMLARARDEIVQSVIIKDNVFEANANVNIDCMTGASWVDYNLLLNGQRFRGRIRIEEDEKRRDASDVYKLVCERLSAHIAEQILLRMGQRALNKAIST